MHDLLGLLVSAITWFWDVFMHLDQHLVEWTQVLGGWLYGVLFLIIFCETGLVVTPILPGDSLLFAVGALAALDGSGVSLALVLPLLVAAAILGDGTNYFIGRWVGPRVFSQKKSMFFNTEYLHRAQAFYEKHGGKTIALARFVPIIRTFAPFVAGIGKMTFRRYAMFNVAGGATWVSSFLILGYAFGNAPGVKQNFHFVVVGIILVSLLPMAVELLQSRRRGRTARPAREH